MPTTEPMRVELVHAWPDRWWSLSMSLPAGATVGDALQAAAPALRDEGLDASAMGMAVFGRTATAATRLHAGDRIELLRPLLASPMQSRSNRAAVAKRRAAQARSAKRPD